LIVLVVRRVRKASTVFSGRCSVDAQETLIDLDPIAAVHGERVRMRESATGRASAFTLELNTQRFLFPVHTVKVGHFPEISDLTWKISA
jgi:hypothetical protein